MTVRRIPPEAFGPGPATPGMTRHEAVADDPVWAGVVDTEPGMASGWHHHGEHRTVFYVLSGRITMEFGPGGRERFEAAAGDFVEVPPGVVHREGNPFDEPARVVLFRSGEGPTVVNVDGPEG